MSDIINFNKKRLSKLLDIDDDFEPDDVCDAALLSVMGHLSKLTHIQAIELLSLAATLTVDDLPYNQKGRYLRHKAIKRFTKDFKSCLYSLHED